MYGKARGPERIRGRGPCLVVLDGANLLRLRTLLALGDLELDPLVLLQRAVAARLDRGEVHEHVGSATVHGDEAEAFFGVEPLDGSLRHVSLLHEGVPAARAAGLTWPFSSSGAFCRSRRAAQVRSTYTKTQQRIHVDPRCGGTHRNGERFTFSGT